MLPSAVSSDEEPPEHYGPLPLLSWAVIRQTDIYQSRFIYKNSRQLRLPSCRKSFATAAETVLLGAPTHPRDAEIEHERRRTPHSPPGVHQRTVRQPQIAGLKSESFNLQYGMNYIAVMPTNPTGPNDNFDWNAATYFLP